jgi:hypothetical protein
MAQGTRGRLLRAAAAGFGVLLCTGLIGCADMNWAKLKDQQSKKAQQPLPGMIPANGSAAVNGTNPTPGAFGNPATNNRPGMFASTTGTPAGRVPTTGNNTLTNGGIVPINYETQTPPGGFNAPVRPGVFTPNTPSPGAYNQPPLAGEPVPPPAPPQIPSQIPPPAGMVPGGDSFGPISPPGAPVSPYLQRQ